MDCFVALAALGVLAMTIPIRRDAPYPFIATIVSHARSERRVEPPALSIVDIGHAPNSVSLKSAPS
jgi:hypothetical protein